MSNYQDKVVLVTGGSKGIGLACAKQFVAQGAKVIISARTQAHIDEALKELPGTAGFRADLSDEHQAAAMVTDVLQQFGRIDVLINSAGAAKRTPVAELQPAAWRAAMDAKFFPTINVIDPVVKLMAAQGTGVIINIIGSGGKVASPTHLAGGSANAALMLATAGLGNAYAASGVRVLGINPGLTETGRVKSGMEAEAKFLNISPQQALDSALKKIPMGRLAKPEEVADLALFLASDKARYLTGTTIQMDGAQSPLI